jgi:hypothetical protein
MIDDFSHVRLMQTDPQSQSLLDTVTFDAAGHLFYQFVVAADPKTMRQMALWTQPKDSDAWLSVGGSAVAAQVLDSHVSASAWTPSLTVTPTLTAISDWTGDGGSSFKRQVVVLGVDGAVLQTLPFADAATPGVGTFAASAVGNDVLFVWLNERGVNGTQSLGLRRLSCTL